MGVEVEDSSSGNASDGVSHMKLPFLALQLTSWCAAKFLTGHGLVPVCSRGWGVLGTPAHLENFSTTI